MKLFTQTVNGNDGNTRILDIRHLLDKISYESQLK
jgi:hypothetical protein